MVNWCILHGAFPVYWWPKALSQRSRSPIHTHIRTRMAEAATQGAGRSSGAIWGSVCRSRILRHALPPELQLLQSQERTLQKGIKHIFRISCYISNILHVHTVISEALTTYKRLKGMIIIFANISFFSSAITSEFKLVLSLRCSQVADSQSFYTSLCRSVGSIIYFWLPQCG